MHHSKKSNTGLYITAYTSAKILFDIVKPKFIFISWPITTKFCTNLSKYIKKESIKKIYNFKCHMNIGITMNEIRYS